MLMPQMTTSHLPAKLPSDAETQHSSQTRQLCEGRKRGVGQCFWGHGGVQTWGNAWGWQKLRGPSRLSSEQSNQVFHAASLPCP